MLYIMYSAQFYVSVNLSWTDKYSSVKEKRELKINACLPNIKIKELVIFGKNVD